MKTKNKLFILALALCLIFTLAACGGQNKRADGGGQSKRADGGWAASNDAAYPAPEAAEAPQEMPSLADAAGEQQQNKSIAFAPEKIIYTGHAEIETLDFDKTMTDLQAMIESCGGFIQSSNVSGGDYRTLYGGGTVYRRADYSIRIPVESFEAVQNSLSTLGNVVNRSTNADNITSVYTDTESRLATYRVQEERLLDLLGKATSVEDMITIENSLSEVRYNIESLTSQLKNWDSQINYSTLSLYITEVTLYSKDNTPTVSYGEQLRQTFSHSLYAMGEFFKDLFKFLVGALPALVVLAVIAVPIVLIVRAAQKKRRAASAAPENRDGGGNPQG